MFNQQADRNRAGEYEADSYSFGQQPSWGRYDLNDTGLMEFSTPDNSQQHPQQYNVQGHVPRQSFSSSLAMDWMSTPPDMQANFGQSHQQHSNEGDGMDFESFGSIQEGGVGGNGGGSVRGLVAQFENKSYVPPLPPRPIQTSNHVMTPMGPPSPGPSSHFGSLNAVTQGHVATSPLASPGETQFGSFDVHSRIASPLATSPPPMTYGSYQDGSRVSSPIGGTSAGPFGSLDNFMSGQRMPTPMDSSPMVASPGQSTPGVTGGTPGFEIWRPPPAMTTKQEPQLDTPISPGGSYFRPPVPTTPKPVMNGGSQFILDFNPTSRAKGKAPAKPPAKPPRPKIAPPPPTFSPQVKEEPATPLPLDTPSSSTSISQSQRQGSVSLRSQTGTRPSREQVPAEAWEQFKSTIRTLYLEERKPLKDVMSIMADKYGFQATPKMYKTRFSQWGFVKNNTEDEVKRLLSMKFQRDAEGKVSEFVRNGKVVNLGTYLKRKGVTEYDLVDFELPADLPSHIRCRTPTPPLAQGILRSPDLMRAQELVVGNMRKAFLHCRQVELETDAQISWQSIMVWGAGSSDMLLEANFYFEAQDADQGGQFLMRAFKQLEEDLKQLSPQGIIELLLGMVQRDPGMSTALCKYLAAYSTTNLDRSHPLRQIFTCLYEVQQKHGSSTLSELLWTSIGTIAEELEAIYGRRHPYVARTWVDLALFFNQPNPERLDKLIPELRTVQRQIEQRLGPQSVESLVLRFTVVQLLFVGNPHAEASKHASNELWNHMKSMNLVFLCRDSRPNVYCYHSPLKVDPWTKRCRRRYDSLSTIMEQHVGVKVHPYFEEDFHITEHAPASQDSWAAAMQQMQSRWGFI